MLCVGDVVWVRFPFDERENHPANVTHPCLILELDDAGRMLVAYGTSQHTSDVLEHEVLVDHQSCGPEALAEMGLTKDTRFCLKRRKWVPMTGQFISKRIGHIPRRLLNRFMRAAKAAGLI